MPATLRCPHCGEVNDVTPTHEPHPDAANRVYPGPDGQPRYDKVPVNVLAWTCPACGQNIELDQPSSDRSLRGVMFNADGTPRR